MPIENQVKGMNELRQGYNIVALSQVKNFISIGGPNAGVANAVCADIGGYLRGCRFLPKLNNEIPNAFNSTYKERFSSLQNLILIMFENDLIVTPKESSWFGFYQDGSYTQVLPPQQTNLYLNDLFGLQTLDKAGKIKFIKVPGFHLGMDIQELGQYVVPYLIDGGAPAPASTPTVSPVVQFSFKKKLVINDTAIGKEKLVL
ncbi:hypothetical protein FXO38_19440 [Capsicum annuum]|nr:hypothetical protein FXO38_19440 [Capsicum annuum]